MGKIPKKEKQINDNERIERLNSLLARIDSPKEGDEVIFTIKGDSIKYHGVIEKKVLGTDTVNYSIVAKGRQPPKGVIEAITYKGRTFILREKL